ncbi:UNVERIFIED_CONTAM: hypothetical protein FKN15_002946 [Acipenser sinensis]
MKENGDNRVSGDILQNQGQLRTPPPPTAHLSIRQSIVTSLSSEGGTSKIN